MSAHGQDGGGGGALTEGGPPLYPLQTQIIVLGECAFPMAGLQESGHSEIARDAHACARFPNGRSAGIVLHGSEVPFSRMVGRIVLHGSEVPFSRMVGRIVLHGSEVPFPRMVGRIVLLTD